MSQRIGFLVVNQKSGFMLETKEHAAKIFDTLSEAKTACPPLGSSAPVPLNYDNTVLSLLKGAVFCFTTEDGHRKFLGRVRNDPAHKAFVAFSQDRNFVQWRHKNVPAASPANVVSDAAEQASAKSAPVLSDPGPVSFNPDILVR